ncbi:nucleotidyltransferase domain-containing protein [Lichenibacterium dinghuense]|uniref:nucleotidyltransferase domain-containing protein n=1 Tax=Lichenibacterium dinghuense TaxID=2895977 RepID=UPI001F38FAE3|nr:nucleotidyltransferase domain-containing protein [Lichenibacterium sp. 6Y81]
MTAQPAPIASAPPVDDMTLRAARRFLALVGERYPVREAYLFGSRARGTHRPDSDADVAVVLRGETDDRGAAVLDMADVAFDVMMDLDVLVEATPLWEGEFDDAESGLTRYLVRDIRRDGIRL